MEFKFRAGEQPDASYFSPPPHPFDGYFTAQALRAGYIGGDLNYRTPEPLPHHPLIPARDAVRRELEKERIREEIIAGEILRRRELEEEVRRELAMEREIVLREQADRFSLASGMSERKGVGSALVRNKFSGPGRREVVVGERVLPVENGVRTGKSTTSVTNVDRTKKKATASSELKEWTCALCHVHCTSEQDLNEHFRGKKHKQRAKEEKLKGSKGGVKNLSVLVPKNITDQPKITKKVATNGLNQNLKQTKKVLAVNQLTNQSVQKNQVVVAKKEKFAFVCKQCEINCNSELMMVAHLSGKKHLTQLRELEASGKGTTDKVASVPVPKNITDQPKITKKVANNGLNQNPKQTKKRIAVNLPTNQSVQKNQVVVAKKGKFTFVCNQCKIKCNSVPMMIAHLSGKKHLTRLQELEASGKGTTDKAASVPLAKTITDQPRITKKVATNGLNQNLKQKKKVLAANQPTNQSAQKNQVVVAKKRKLTFVCKQCKINCNSVLMMVAHLSGKKHLTQLQELVASGKGTTDKAASFGNG